MLFILDNLCFVSNSISCVAIVLLHGSNNKLAVFEALLIDSFLISCSLLHSFIYDGTNNEIRNQK